MMGWYEEYKQCGGRKVTGSVKARSSVFRVCKDGSLGGLGMGRVEGCSRTASAWFSRQ